MTGGPSQHDLWDYKPKMRELAGEELPAYIRDGQRVTGMSKGVLKVMPSEYSFSRYDNYDRGVWVSELLPHTAKVVKDLCVIHSVHTGDQPRSGITYIRQAADSRAAEFGRLVELWLGSEIPFAQLCRDAFDGIEQSITLFGRLWGSGFMPSNHRGVIFRERRSVILIIRKAYLDPNGATSWMPLRRSIRSTTGTLAIPAFWLV